MNASSQHFGSRDAQIQFHERWLGLAQPIEGLVFSTPVLADAQIAPEPDAAIGVAFTHWLQRGNTEETPTITALTEFFNDFLGYSTSDNLIERKQLPEDIHFYAQEGRQDIRPSFAITRVRNTADYGDDEDDPFGGFGMDNSGQGTQASVAEQVNTTGNAEHQFSPWLMLVWHLPDDAGKEGLRLNLDRSESVTGNWHYPATAKFERLLRHTGVPIGLLSNGSELRLMYAPAGESTSHLTFRCADMAVSGGKSLLSAFELLLGAKRAYQASEEHTLEGLLRQSRERQADVTAELAEQVFEAVEILLHGFEVAAGNDKRHALGSGQADIAPWLQQALVAEGGHFYQGVLSVVLRSVFLLYAEDQSLLPVGHPFYAQHLSVKALYEELVEDSGMHPESMHHRFGAYGRLLTLFRAVYLGVSHQDFQLPPRRGKLFDPSSFPFLEGGLPGSTAAVANAADRSAVEPPLLDDGVIHEVLTRLILLHGQRLSYRDLDVEQIGSVYESLMGFHVQRTLSHAVRIGKKRVWVEMRWLREQSKADRKKWLKSATALTPAKISAVEQALAEHDTDAALADALHTLLVPRKGRHRHRVEPGRLIMQPGEERRRSSSHYTPRSLTSPIVQRTLAPILARLGDAPSELQILSIKVCDPAMGSGAFLVEACRHLADQLVNVWTREQQVAAIEERVGDAHLHARRLVAQRCLYGVDKNQAAVELAKLSLWLVTLSEQLPFTFVDHALRHGDALVGLNLAQIRAFNWEPGQQAQLSQQLFSEALEEAIAEREAILELAEFEDPDSQNDKRRRLVHADRALDKVRRIADVCVGAFFSADKARARNEERMRRQLIVEQALDGDEVAEQQLYAIGQDSHRVHAPFHWWLEFPEVFRDRQVEPSSDQPFVSMASMDAVVGNPPFAGKNNILDSSGPYYLHWLKAIHVGAHGNADLSSHFFRRAGALLGANGSLGLIATNTIAQGDTRTTGLQYLVNNGMQIVNATNSMPWPGDAAVTVSVVHLVRGSMVDGVKRFLDEKPVDAINSRLRGKPEREDPVALQSNAGCAFVGSYVLGMGFTLTPEQRSELIAKNPANAERIFPYLGGEEVNTSPTQAFHRYVISFGQMTLAEAEAWPDLLAIVRETVKPERDKNNREQYRKNWWQFGELRPALTAALVPLERCLVTARVTKHLGFSYQSVERLFNEKLYIFPVEPITMFSVVQSRVHECWARLLSSTLKTDMNYSASDCFDTFPFPTSGPRVVSPELESIGKTLYDTRAQYMLDSDQGLTKTYNALKDPDNDDPAIKHLRTLHENMDRAVLDAYGWQDVSVPPYCLKSAADEAAVIAFEDEVIDRLYLLNEQRAREEQRLGLGKKKTTAKKRASRKKAATKKRAAARGQGALFPDEEPNDG